MNSPQNAENVWDSTVKFWSQNQSLSVTTMHLQWPPTSQTNHRWQTASKEVAHLSHSPLATAIKFTLFTMGNSYNPQKQPLYLSSRVLSHISENSSSYQKSNLTLSALILPTTLLFTNKPLKLCKLHPQRECSVSSFPADIWTSPSTLFNIFFWFF